MTIPNRRNRRLSAVTGGGGVTGGAGTAFAGGTGAAAGVGAGAVLNQKPENSPCDCNARRPSLACSRDVAAR